MGDKNFTLVYYYIPEDKDDISILNAFGIKKPLHDLRVSDIQSSFPLEGQYHFRFKYKHGPEYVWMDVLKPDAKPPIVDGKIVLKVTRRTWEGKTSSHVNQTISSKAAYNFNELLEDFESPAVTTTKNEIKKQPAPTPNVILL